MSDNTVLATMSGGDTIATDDIGSGVKVQRVKAGFGVDGSYADVAVDSGLPVQSGFKEYAALSVAANNTDLMSADVSPYRWVAVHLTGTWSATVTFQTSNDGTNWVSAPLVPINTAAQSAAATAAFTGLYAGPVGGRYFRARTTAYTSGTVTGVVDLWALPASPATVPVHVQDASLSVAPVSTGLPSGDALSTFSGFAGPQLLYVAGASAVWDRARTPNVFKSAVATASGNTALWTPTSGRKFRLLRYRISVTVDAAQTAGGVITVGLQDATTDIGLSESVFVPTTAATTFGAGWSTGWINLGNGRVSSAANAVLNINLSAALTSGTVRVVACGTEE